MMNSGGYSLADIAAATGGAERSDGMWGDGNWLWIIVVFSDGLLDRGGVC